MLMTMNTTTSGREMWATAGDWLREQRDRGGMSQRELGRAIGASYQSVSNYERGISAPSDDTCERIARVFHLNPEEVRERWGKWTRPGQRSAPPPVSLEDAIRADPRLLPEARDHLLNQVGLLLRIQQTPPRPTPESLAAELQADVEREEQPSPKRHPRDEDHR